MFHKNQNLRLVSGQEGFHHVLVPLVIVVVAVIGFVGWQVAHKNQTTNHSSNGFNFQACLKEHQKPGQDPHVANDACITLQNQYNAAHRVRSTAQNQEQPSKQTAKPAGTDLLYLKGIGFNIDNYNPATNHAGDMVFTHENNNLEAAFHRIFQDFGTQSPRDPNDPTKRNPQPTFILPLGTKVHSLVDGVVFDVADLYSGDVSVMVSADGKQSSYIYETEHIVNPLVKVGDKVKAGQVIGEVSPHDSEYHPGFGILEIGILHPLSNGGTSHLCPFHYLDPSIKKDIENKILNIHKAWANYTGIQNLPENATEAEPGCFSLDPVSG